MTRAKTKKMEQDFQSLIMNIKGKENEANFTRSNYDEKSKKNKIIKN